MSVKNKEELNDQEKAIYWILEDLGEATTAEVIKETLDLPNNCKDKVPSLLKTLQRYNLISQRISKEKKAIVWSVCT